MPLRGIGRAQYGGGMNGRHHVWRPRMLKWNAAFLRQPKLTPEKGLRRRGPKANDNLGLDQFHFRLQPGPAGAHFSHAWLLMQPPLPAFFEFEMFDHVRHINFRTLDGRICESPVEDSPRESDKRMALDILFIPGLLADQRQVGRSRTFAKDSLRGLQIQIA